MGVVFSTPESISNCSPNCGSKRVPITPITVRSSPPERWPSSPLLRRRSRTPWICGSVAWLDITTIIPQFLHFSNRKFRIKTKEQRISPLLLGHDRVSGFLSGYRQGGIPSCRAIKVIPEQADWFHRTPNRLPSVDREILNWEYRVDSGSCQPAKLGVVLPIAGRGKSR